MKKSKIGVLSVTFPLSLCLSLSLVACGGSDDDKATGGSGGSTSSGGSKTSTGGSSTSSGGNANPGGGTDNKAGTSSSVAGTSSGPGPDVDGDKPLSELTDDELEELCQDFEEKFGDEKVTETMCRFNGVLSAILAQTDADAQATCKTSYDQCTAEPTDTTQDCEKPSSTCTATVDEVQACLDDVNELFGTLSDSIPSCDTLKRSDAAAVLLQASTFMNPASCAAYQAKCPDGPVPSIPTAEAP